MPVTVGLVGDIIALSVLIKDLIKCFDDARGSSAEYQDIVQDLCRLGYALLTADALLKSLQGSNGLENIRDQAATCVQQCQNHIIDFRTRVEKKYGISLRPGGSGNWIKDTAKKVMWGMLEKDALPKLRLQVNGYCNTLIMFLVVVDMYVGARDRARLWLDDNERMRTNDGSQNMNFHGGNLQQSMRSLKSD